MALPKIYSNEKNQIRNTEIYTKTYCKMYLFMVSFNL